MTLFFRGVDVLCHLSDGAFACGHARLSDFQFISTTVKTPRGPRNALFDIGPISRRRRIGTSLAALPRDLYEEGSVKEKILIVDDDEGVRQVLSQSLSEGGYRVFSAESGEKAVSAA